MIYNDSSSYVRWIQVLSDHFRISLSPNVNNYSTLRKRTRVRTLLPLMARRWLQDTCKLEMNRVSPIFTSAYIGSLLPNLATYHRKAFFVICYKLARNVNVITALSYYFDAFIGLSCVVRHSSRLNSKCFADILNDSGTRSRRYCEYTPWFHHTKKILESQKAGSKIMRPLTCTMSFINT